MCVIHYILCLRLSPTYLYILQVFFLVTRVRTLQLLSTTQVIKPFSSKKTIIWLSIGQFVGCLAMHQSKEMMRNGSLATTHAALVCLRNCAWVLVVVVGRGVMRYLWGTDLIWAHFLKCAVCEINCVVKFYANKAPDEIQVAYVGPTCLCANFTRN